MGFDEGSIILSNTNETYYAGQVIYGKLVFEQDKVKTFRGLYVKVKGYCQVHWTTSHTRRENDRNHTYTVNHDSHEEYFNRKIFLLGGENGEYHLQRGKHELPFECPIPANCPSSFEGKHGHVRYEIKIVVDRAFKIDQEKRRTIRVIAPLNLNADPYCREPLQFDIEDTYCCCCMSSGSSETVVKLPAAGFVPGQVVPIEVNCSNQGRVVVDQIKLAVKKRVTFHATSEPGTKHESDTIAEVKKGPVPGGATRSWVLDMQMPLEDVYNLGPCRYIDIDYDFKVTVSPEGCHSDSEDTRRIVMGTSAGPAPFEPDSVQTAPALNVPYPQNSYPGQTNSYPVTSPYPVGQSPYPANTSPYPPNTSPYPPNTSSYPPNTSPYPTNTSPYPTNTSPYPVAPALTSPYPSNAATYPATSSPYPTNTTPYPANASPYLTTTTPYPNNTASYPTTTSPYPPTTPPYPTNISPYPVVTPPCQGTAPSCPSAPPETPPVEAQSPRAPLLPPGAQVPFPMPVSSNSPYNPN